MKVTRIEVIRSKKPIILPIGWKPAWWPDIKPVKSFSFSLFKVYTDEGIVGFGPYTGELTQFALSALIGLDPFHVEWFWSMCMRGRETCFNRGSYGGLEIALWDIVGKALGKPVYRILGAFRDCIMAYAATSRLLKPEQHVKQVLQLMDAGFKAVKLRLHRPKPEDDLKVVRAVKDAVGDDLTILVDANQNNQSISYRYWSRRTALKMARELDKLGVYFLEDPLPRRDVEGLSELAASVDMFIAGGEHSANIYEFREYLLRGAYDVLQPDVILGDMGITGIRKVAFVADYFNRLVIPHVRSGSSLPLGFAATLQAAATINNCPMIEYPYDPPVLTVETQQGILREPLVVDRDGTVKVPEKPGIGVEVDEDKMRKVAEFP